MKANDRNKLLMQQKVAIRKRMSNVNENNVNMNSVDCLRELVKVSRDADVSVGEYGNALIKQTKYHREKNKMKQASFSWLKDAEKYNNEREMLEKEISDLKNLKEKDDENEEIELATKMKQGLQELRAICDRLKKISNKNKNIGNELEEKLKESFEDKSVKIRAIIITSLQQLKEEEIRCEEELKLFSVITNDITIENSPNFIIESSSSSSSSFVSEFAKKVQSDYQQLLSQQETKRQELCSSYSDVYPKDGISKRQWSSDEHLHFQMVMNASSSSRKVALTRLTIEMQALNIMPHELEAHYDYCVRYQSFQQKLKSLSSMERKSRREFFSDAYENFGKEQKKYLEEEERNIEVEELNRIREDMHSKISEWKTHLSQVEEERKKDVEKEDEEKRQEKILYDQLRQAKSERLHAKVKEYRFLLDEEEKLKREKELQEEKEDEDRIKRLLEEYLPRIQFREQLLDEKRKKKEANDLILKKQEEEKLQRLEAIRQQVAVIVEDDPERVKRPTQSHLNSLQSINNKNSNEIGKNIIGFQNDVNLTDPRYRIEAALAEAGLAKSDYARTMILQVHQLNNKTILQSRNLQNSNLN